MPHPYRLLHSSALVVDFFSSGKARPFVAFTFTPAMNQQLEGTGFAGQFLLENGFDVIAFKNVRNDWYQTIEPRDLSRISDFASQRSYDQRVAYGSSMGGFAAIAFSGLLDIDRVLSISPQFDIRLPDDTRWHDIARTLTWRHSIAPATLRKDCRYFIIYDDRCIDRIHVERITQVMSADQATEIRIPYSGHPSGYFLMETGQLKTVARSILLQGTAPAISRDNRRQSKSFHIQIASELMRAEKYKSAERVLTLAAALAPDDIQILQLHKRTQVKLRKAELRRHYPAAIASMMHIIRR